jgi:hypothetical protein
MIDLCNCRFGFRCPKQWDDLKPTDKATVRYCDHCEENVYSCNTQRELIDAMKKNHCVAIMALKTNLSPEGHALVEEAAKYVKDAQKFGAPSRGLRMLLGRVVSNN